ncbi:ring-like domain-containing [Trichoderma arundinaceum]|uniref:Ring-like domain-containing n=1 Tax=Trichoderma arundinaceum TaxID=490622 RepID=A0A395NDC3_TRIAR|nr:ring-like domain-containing [Trichoderma arundinaceum]
MLEYFSYKKYKKNREEREGKEVKKNDGKTEADASKPVAKKDEGKKDETYDSSSSEHQLQRAVLKPEDERFLEELLAQTDDVPPPPLPPRIYTYDVDWHSGSEASADESKKTTDDEADQAVKASEAVKKEGDSADAIGKVDKGKEKADKKPNRFSLLFTRNKKPADSLKSSDTLKPDTENVTPKEAEREKKDLHQVLDRLNLSAKNNKVVSESKESSDLLQRFTQVFKDLVNGVPTAYDDLTKLIEDRDGSINRLFEKLPSSLKKLVTQLPEKLTTTLAPEILAAAAESQGIKAAESGMKGTAKRMLFSQNLADLVKKPGAIVGMLRAIVEVLKTRWPAFIGMNVIWSVALSLLLVVLWYCYKRGREERILREEAGAGAEADGQRFEELSDDADAAESPKNNAEAIEAAEVIPVIITSPEGEQITPAAPKESSPKEEEASTADVPQSDAPEEQNRP